MDATQEIKSIFATDMAEGVAFQENMTHHVSETARPDLAVEKKGDEESGSIKVQEITKEFVEEIAEKMNDVASIFNASLSFSVDQPTGKRVIKVVNKDTDELIRQIPPENALKLISNMRNVMGMLLDVEI